MKESSLLQQIYKKSTNDDLILIGPGDDMALLEFEPNTLLCGVDQLIVGKHVTIDTPPKLIGRKAVARCFSDVAAMGGIPVGSLMTAALPLSTDEAWAMAVFDGAREHAAKWGGPIVGGDIASSAENAQPMFSVTTFGTIPTTAIKRNNAQVDDVIYVTGKIGNSIENHHLHFTPRINEAQMLINSIKISSMIDISDGLGQDASHLATNKTQLVINPTMVPLRKGAILPSAFSDGEDYELLFTSAMKPSENLATPIGFVQHRNANEPKVITTSGEDISNLGWSHE